MYEVYATINVASNDPNMKIIGDQVQKQIFWSADTDYKPFSLEFSDITVDNIKFIKSVNYNNPNLLVIEYIKFVNNKFNQKGNNMSTQQAIKDAMTAFEMEDAKFEAGNSSAGTRARKALGDLGKLVKARRSEITETKNARKEAK